VERSTNLEPAQLITILTTEHFALQGARSAALTDMQGRATLFTTALSSTLVALALVGNIAKLGPAFQAFTFVMLPTLYVFGILMYLRIVQISLEDVLRARGLARIRHWYLEHARELAPYFLTTTHDDFAGMVAEMGVRTGPLQLFMSTEAVIAFVDSVLLGVLISMVGVLQLHAGLLVAVGGGAVATAASLGALSLLSSRMWAALDRDHVPLFPSPATVTKAT